MEQHKNIRKTMLTVIGIAVLIIGLVDVTYAFFNYTRTGSTNVVKVGSISFNSMQDDSININNLFPIRRNEIDIKTDYVDSVKINVVGSTDYIANEGQNDEYTYYYCNQENVSAPYVYLSVAGMDICIDWTSKNYVNGCSFSHTGSAYCWSGYYK